MNNIDEIINLDDLDYNNLIFEHPIKKNNIYLTYIYKKKKNEKIIPIIKVPYMKLLDNKNYKYIFLQFNPSNDYSLYNFLSNFDNNIIKLISKKSKTWFGKTMPINIVDEIYKSTIKSYKESVNPRIKIKIKNNEYINENFYNKNVIPYFKFKYLKFTTNESYLELELYKLDLLEEETNDVKDVQDIENKIDISKTINFNETIREEIINLENINNINEIKSVDKIKNREYIEKKLDKYTNELLSLSNKINKYRNLLLEKNNENSDSD